MFVSQDWPVTPGPVGGIIIYSRPGCEAKSHKGFKKGVHKNKQTDLNESCQQKHTN